MPFLPKDFVVPAIVDAGTFRLRPITIHDAFRDYDAVMSSREHLWARLGEAGGWPAADLSPEQMAEAVKNRGDDGLTLILGITADMMRQMNRQEMKRQKAPVKAESDLDLLSLLVDPNGPVKMKRLMAEQMAKLVSGRLAAARRASSSALSKLEPSTRYCASPTSTASLPL
mgnify:CR=1 FL=1